MDREGEGTFERSAGERKRHSHPRKIAVVFATRLGNRFVVVQVRQRRLQALGPPLSPIANRDEPNKPLPLGVMSMR